MFCPSIVAVIDSPVGPGLRTEQAGPTVDEGPITYLATPLHCTFPAAVVQYGQPPVGCPLDEGAEARRFSRLYEMQLASYPRTTGRWRQAYLPTADRERSPGDPELPAWSLEAYIGMSLDRRRIGWLP